LAGEIKGIFIIFEKPLRKFLRGFLMPENGCFLYFIMILKEIIRRRLMAEVFRMIL
jgi:hypothetical protein